MFSVLMCLENDGCLWLCVCVCVCVPLLCLGGRWSSTKCGGGEFTHDQAFVGLEGMECVTADWRRTLKWSEERATWLA